MMLWYPTTVVYVVPDGRIVPHISGESAVPDEAGVVPDGMGVESNGRTVPHISGDVALDITSEVAVPDGGLIMLAIEPIGICTHECTESSRMPGHYASDPACPRLVHYDVAFGTSQT
jgi:hypothetical protein